MIEVPLTKGAVCFVDDEDDWVLDFKWHLAGTPGYAARNTRRALGRITWMHVEILALIVGHRDFEVADHVDRNPMNNSRSNLRVATYKLNAQNRVWTSAPGHQNRRLPDPEPRDCGFCGVSFTPRRKTANLGAKFCSRKCQRSWNIRVMPSVSE